MDIWQLLKVAQNEVNRDVYRSIISSTKYEPVLTKYVSISDFMTAFSRLESEGSQVTTILCHPVRIKEIRKGCKGDNYYRDRNVPESEDFQLSTSPSYAWVGTLMTAAIRVCDIVDVRRIWVSTGVPQDSDLSLLSDSERDTIEQIFGDTVTNYSHSGEKIYSAQIIIC